MELLVGCGSRRDKLVYFNGNSQWRGLVTLDHNDRHNPDIVWNLNQRPLPFEDNSIDEVHAYEVIEHLGNGIGDYRSWFAEWSEWWRILKPGGFVCGTSPARDSVWLFGDPSHCRVVSPEMMIFLHQPSYTEQIGKTPMSDFRNIYQADFDLMLSEQKDETFIFALQAVKPSRIT